MTKYYIIRIYATLHKNYLLLHAILKQESTIVIFFLVLKQYGYIPSYRIWIVQAKEDILIDVFFSYIFMNSFEQMLSKHEKMLGVQNELFALQQQQLVFLQ
ncbi:Uncharacterised protein [Streptococcus pneumoniae]|nr:Uncharacterised protein [Streptococcus pneumoniae]